MNRKSILANDFLAWQKSSSTAALCDLLREKIKECTDALIATNPSEQHDEIVRLQSICQSYNLLLKMLEQEIPKDSDSIKLEL